MEIGSRVEQDLKAKIEEVLADLRKQKKYDGKEIAIDTIVLTATFTIYEPKTGKSDVVTNPVAFLQINKPFADGQEYRSPGI